MLSAILNYLKNLIFVLKYNLPLKERKMWCALLIEDLGDYKVVMPYFKIDGHGKRQYITHRVGDIVPVLPCGGEKAAYYKIIKKDRYPSLLGCEIMYDDYFMIFDHIGPMPEPIERETNE